MGVRKIVRPLLCAWFFVRCFVCSRFFKKETASPQRNTRQKTSQIYAKP